MLSLGATPPVETTRANTSVPPDPANFPSTFGSNANRLPPGVPLPPGAQFSLNRPGRSLEAAARPPGFRDLRECRRLATGRSSARPTPALRRTTTSMAWRACRVGLLGRRRLLQQQHHSSDPDRALGRDLVGHRQLAQHQHHAEQRPHWRDVRVGVGVLGRRLLLQQQRIQTLIGAGTGPVGHRQLAQHQRYEQPPQMA